MTRGTARCIDPRSFDRQRSLTTRLLASSVEAGWRSTLLEHRRCEQAHREFELLPTGDLNLVLQLDGLLHVEELAQGRWAPVTCAAGTLGITLPEDRRRFRQRIPAPFEQLHLFIPGAVLQAAIDMRPVGSARSVQDLARLRIRDPLIAETMHTLLRGMTQRQPDLFAEQAVTWLATYLVADVGAEVRAKAQPGDDRRIGRAITLIRDTFAAPLSLDMLAAEAGISKFHFSRRFKQQTGSSPHRYLEEVRMEEAGRLLRATGTPISEVARLCGYEVPARFSTVFRRHHATSPAAYRDAPFLSAERDK